MEEVDVDLDQDTKKLSPCFVDCFISATALVTSSGHRLAFKLLITSL